jgi:arogenate/prephenate dehydratase
VPLQAMSVFALRDINMKKLESRPLRSSPILHELDNGRRSYNYVFFIDFIGSTAEVCKTDSTLGRPSLTKSA